MPKKLAALCCVTLGCLFAEAVEREDVPCIGLENWTFNSFSGTFWRSHDKYRSGRAFTNRRDSPPPFVEKWLKKSKHTEKYPGGLLLSDSRKG